MKLEMIKFLLAALVSSGVAVPLAPHQYNSTLGFVSRDLALPQCAPTDHPGDCQALVAFAYATKFESWTKSDNWCLGDTICSWYGVNCSNGRVSQLSLGGNNMVGKLPDQFAQLTELTYLNIGWSDLTSRTIT